MIIIIPGFVIAIVTFPGIILHEMAHKFFCDYYNVAVFEVDYFRISSHAGHVLHERIYDNKKNAVIALAPLFINSIVCMLLFLPYACLYSFGAGFLWEISPLDCFLLWVGAACGLSALPSTIDLANVSSDSSGIYYLCKVLSKFFNWFEFFGSVLWTLILFGLSYICAAKIGSFFY